MHFLRQLRFVAALLAAFFVLSLTACGSGSNSFTWFVDSIPANLDPQVASSASDIIACENLYSGLVRRTPDGSLAPELCEQWEVSADRLTYTFYLKDSLTYTASKGDPTDYAITAEDFVFAFQRMFLPGTNSPYAVEFSALENSAAVLVGQKPASALGVTAAEPLKLVFRLSSPDETFLSKLTLPGAMPCDEAFFDSTRGTYGLTSASTLSSGHFYLYNWTSSGLFLRRAASESQIDSLRLVENTTSSGQSAEELINNEKCTAALDDSGTPTSLQSVSYSDTTWALLFNCDSIFASTELRQALGSAAASAVEVPGGGLFAEAKGLIPDGLTVDGINYRDTAGDVTPAAVDARALYLTARQTLTTSDFNKVSLMVPAGSGVTSAAEEINGVWQKEFSLFFSVEEVDEETFAKRLAEGDYTIALAPISAEGGSVYNMLNQFTAAGGGLTGYADSLYATQLQASTQATGSSRCHLLGDCERQLLNDAVAVPLFAQQKRLLIAPGIQNLIFDPFGPVLDLTYTTKE
jgi:ABC-type oligopeptide transport system substrate-binding subunit